MRYLQRDCLVESDEVLGAFSAVREGRSAEVHA
jgi:hypothetical protein